MKAFIAAAVSAAILATTSALDVKLSGLNYNPRKGADWDPVDKKCKSATEVAADMKILAGITSNIRLYSMTDCNQVELVLPAAKAAGLNVWVGLWVDNNTATVQAEKDAFTALVKKGVIDSTITGIHVGSEAIYRKEVTADEAIQHFKDVKAVATAAGLKVPMTIADIGDIYVANPQLAAAVDIISANAFPFWEAKPVEDCITYFYSRMLPLIQQAKTNNKAIMISETGWATNGKAAGASVASPENTAIWFNDFHVLATQLKWNYYYYTSFDTTWRTNPGANSTDSDVENFFGLYDTQGVLKPAYANLKVKQRVNVLGSANPFSSSSSGTNSSATTKSPSSSSSSSTPSSGSSSGNSSSTTPNATATKSPSSSSTAMGVAILSVIASVVMTVL
ncbi:hypothetical protein AeMF1_004570 [Aphanomyces euteiches]|nr:hypothetical protein AeMF1_004570 [Aphanomyces euteiches]KAH9183276.1 hypothetical protein AeNC1_014748 [Aphanomyces euteiches]